MKCGHCQPDYCACHDFFGSVRAFGRGEYDHLLLGGMTKRKGPTMKTIDAIAAEAMPYGSFVEVGEDGFARVDPTLTCRGGVVKRPPPPPNRMLRGPAPNDASAGENVKVVTEGAVAAVIEGSTIMLEMLEGRIAAGLDKLPRQRPRP